MAPDRLRLVVVGGWGVRVEMLEPVYRRLPAEVTLVSLDDRLLEHCQSVSDAADELLSTCSEPAIWMGWSLGAAIVMEAASRATGAVRAAVTLAGFPRFVAANGWTTGMSRAEFSAFARGLRQDPERYWLHFQLLMINGCANETQARQQLKPWLEAGAPVSPEGLAHTLTWLRDLDQRGRWQALDIPALHLLGREDVIVRPWSGQLALGPNSRIETIDGMAHWPVADQAQLCANAIRSFLSVPEVAEWV